MKGFFRIYAEWEKDTAGNESQIGYLILLDVCTGYTNRRIQETKDDKMSVSWYIYLFLLSVLSKDNIYTF
jgi:hypothetical protein